MQKLESISPNALRQQADGMDEAAKTLSEAAAKIREAAVVLETFSGPNGQIAETPLDDALPRVEQLIEWLRQNGPLRRKDIIERCPIPRGTISVLLREENGFARDVEGRWYVQED